MERVPRRRLRVRAGILPTKTPQRYSRNELSEEFRAEIEAEMKMKRACRGGSDEDKARYAAEKAKTRRKLASLKAPKDPKMPNADDVEFIGTIAWKTKRETERVNKYMTRILPRTESDDEPWGKQPTKGEIRALGAGLCPPPPPPEPPSTPPRRVSVLALRPEDRERQKEKARLNDEIDAAFAAGGRSKWSR
jgi:hypothetical protein